MRKYKHCGPTVTSSNPAVYVHCISLVLSLAERRKKRTPCTEKMKEGYYKKRFVTVTTCSNDNVIVS